MYTIKQGAAPRTVSAQEEHASLFAEHVGADPATWSSFLLWLQASPSLAPPSVLNSFTKHLSLYIAYDLFLCFILYHVFFVASVPLSWMAGHGGKRIPP